jgi:hypothetical protein
MYGAWGIYCDGGSSDLLFEHNLVYRTTTGAFHTNAGHDQVFRHNIFAFGRHHQLSFDYPMANHTVRLENTIVLADNANLTNGDWSRMPTRARRNVIWDLSRKEEGRPAEGVLKALGAAYENPRFRDPAKGDFTLEPDSPALALGFIPFDVSAVGPRASGAERRPSAPSVPTGVICPHGN